MKFIRFQKDNQIFYGVLEGETIYSLKGDIFSEYTVTGEAICLGDVRILAPCVPSKAVCIGLNYYDHAAELKMELPALPLLFMKPSSSLAHPGGNIEYPNNTKNLHYEAELAIVIKKAAKNVPKTRAGEYILGYTCANDVTARDIQKSDGQWTRAKSFDTFLPLGPCIETSVDPSNLSIKLYLNNEVKQSSNASNLIFTVADLVEFISHSMTLNPGDVILTGTPSGVGSMQVGDTVTVELEGIGRLTNKIVQG